MITTTDIANILYTDCLNLGMEVYQKGNIPEGEIKRERVVVFSRSNTQQKYWAKSYAEVNICVPDIKRGVANLIRLNELERLATELFTYSIGQYDDSQYRYSIDKIGIEEDSSMKCHYVNVKILFEILNVK